MFSANSSQVSGDKLFVEDVFSTYLYTGNGASSQTITTNVNLTTGGGLVWHKLRSSASDHLLFDTTRNDTDYIRTNRTNDVASYPGRTLAIGTSGFTVGSDAFVNGSGNTFATWSFKKSLKFFDMQTWTGTGVARTISHNLGVAPGCIIIKRIDGFTNWQVYHRSNANTQYMVLNTTDAVATSSTLWNSTTPTETEFTVGADATVNASGGTYVAYLFAHDTSSTGIIQCGSFTATGSTAVNLGWEPQWVLVRRTDSTGFWEIIDNMRGFVAQPGTNSRYVMAQSTNAEADFGGTFAPTATGFVDGHATGNYVYIAIRRGPMRTPTSGTSVFSPNTTSTDTATTGFPVDFMMQKTTTTAFSNYAADRLRGATKSVKTNSTDAESTALANWSQSNTGVQSTGIGAGASVIWSFRRAPSFFDEVCYTGTGVTRTINHNLGVAPELMIIKSRSNGGALYGWLVTHTINSTQYYYNLLNTTDQAYQVTYAIYSAYLSSAPTSTQFSIGNDPIVNNSGTNYVAYLFASCPGVSKVFSFTGNGSSQTINCGFSSGARFVMIKRTDSTGDWWVWDTARGLVSGNDPALRLNSTAAETTGIDSIDPDSSGFIVNQDATTNINVNGASYVGIAIS